MDIRLHTLRCCRCGHTHEIEIDFDILNEDQKNGLQPVLENFICPDIARMYKVVNFNLDLRINSIKNVLESANIGHKNDMINRLKNEYGEFNFDAKLERFIKLDFAFIGFPEEYYELLMPIISAYCCGYFYPAITGASSLGERILNRLMLKTRHHFMKSPYYGKLSNKNSLNNWDLLVEVLIDWEVISGSVGDLFLKLKKYRNDSIHYTEDYDFEQNSYQAIYILIQIINKQFNYIERKDLFWVFNCPGEIFLRSSMESSPFVIEFILPHCAWIGPFDEPTSKPPIKKDNSPLKPLKDEDFIKIRKNREI